jgi:hypothetical protein
MMGWSIVYGGPVDKACLRCQLRGGVGTEPPALLIGRRTSIGNHCPERATGVMKRTSIRLYFLASIIIHLLLVMSWGVSSYFRTPEMKADLVEEEDLRYAFELVEVPDNVPREEPDALTNLVSDRAARAADMDPETSEDLDTPSAEGEFEFREFEQIDSEEARADRPDSPDEMDEVELADIAFPESDIDYSEEETPADESPDSRKSLSFDNDLSSSKRRGGLSFNTYNWDFAPYMLAMKRKVESNLYPPYAFTHMGAVSGTTIVRFIVMPDGQVRDLEVLESDAHFSLDRSSVSAIEQSIPFLPLPLNFPEEHLEVTACFSYVIGR